jgi:hypothetical protein
MFMLPLVMSPTVQNPAVAERFKRVLGEQPKAHGSGLLDEVRAEAPMENPSPEKPILVTWSTVPVGRLSVTPPTVIIESARAEIEHKNKIEMSSTNF